MNRYHFSNVSMGSMMVLGINLHFSNVSSVYVVENDGEIVVLRRHFFDRPVLAVMMVVVVVVVQQLLNVWNLEITVDH